MEQTLNRSKSWMLPFWFMLGIMIGSFLENVFVFTVFLHGQWFSRAVVLGAMLWPSILLIEAIGYWLIRKRIEERKFVWVHLLFSLFAFVLLWVLYVIILAFFFSHTGPELYSYYLRIIQKIQVYV